MQTHKDEVRRHAAETDALQQQAAKEAAEAQGKIEGLNDKLKKLKALLGKVNTMAQEKETKVSQLMLLNERAKRFHIVARLSLLTPKTSMAGGGDANEIFPWCLIFEDSVGSGRVRWVEEPQVREWIREGSTLLGSWPQPLNEFWEASLSSVRSELEQQNEEVSGRLEEVSSAFQAYKLRAQTALKRLGNEDRSERQRAHENELSHEVDRLQSVIKSLEEEQSNLKSQLSAATSALAESSVECQSLQDRLDTASRQHEESTASCKEMQRKLRETIHEAELLRGEKAVAEEMLRESSSKYHELLQQCSGMDFDSSYSKHESAASHDKARTASVAPRLNEDSPLVVATATAVEVVDATEQEEQFLGMPPPLNISKEESRVSSRSADSEQAISLADTARAAKDEASRKGPPQQQRHRANIDSYDSGPNSGKMLLHQQADSNLKDSVAVLRRENSSLTVELIELKNDVSLREEQINALKVTVRELEASMMREKEFNAASRRINADYLVNVLRNFLMSTNPSERMKLVPVLCTLLHLQPDETKLIVDKWTVKSGGLVGWLLPPRPASNGSSTGSGLAAGAHSPDNDGILVAPGSSASMNRGGSRGKSADLSYDPVTGSGVGAGLDIYA